MAFEDLNRADIQELYDQQLRHYQTLQQAGLKLDLTRGKPSAEQLDLSLPLLSLPGDAYIDSSGVDTRNYGGLNGLTELREIFAPILQAPAEQIVVGDNASLAMMHDNLAFALLHGTVDSDTAWIEQRPIKFLCPVPGYDRHFTLTESFGIEMIPIETTDSGPNMEQVRQYVEDPAVKGIWLVPTYANPSAIVVSEQIAAELAAMQTAAPDFRIFSDNAYAVHHLTDQHAKTADMLGLCSGSGHPNRAVVFASTSKITFAGSGVCFMASSPENVAWYLKHISKRTIGPDKVNQLRHVRFLKDTNGVYDLMVQHRAILAPKFDRVQAELVGRLSKYGVATWTKPAGGYFVSLDVVDGTASRVVELAKEAGVALTPAGASFPYGTDPRDRNIRIAPSFPPIGELTAALEVLATCVLLAAAEQALNSTP